MSSGACISIHSASEMVVWLRHVGEDHYVLLHHVAPHRTWLAGYRRLLSFIGCDHSLLL